MSGSRLGAGFPLSLAPLVDPKTGMATSVGLELLLALWRRTGGPAGTSAADLSAQIAAMQAALAEAGSLAAETNVLATLSDVPEVPAPDLTALLMHEPADAPAADPLLPLVLAD